MVGTRQASETLLNFLRTVSDFHNAHNSYIKGIFISGQAQTGIAYDLGKDEIKYTLPEHL